MEKRKCNNCGRANTCEYAKHIENYRIDGVCHNYIPENIVYDIKRAGQKSIPTYEEFVAPVGFLSPDDQREWLNIYHRYLNKRSQEWNSKYTYCAGECHKTVERSNTVIKHEGNKIVTCCGICGTVWYVRDKDE